MKKIILLSILAIIISITYSCKKEYNCHCNSTIISSNSYTQDSYSSKSIKMNKKMTKKQAQAVCSDEEKNIDATYNNFVTNNGNWSANGVTAHTICTLE